ncbi:MAG: methyltransferase domain-containing protein [Candidatus Aenigmarchaeota archaeon]|nr:methyltransferase domain-containing protein [Candidatus Aenigmarchaeota archaeon]
MKRENILDILKKTKRLPQAVIPKDAGMIVAYTGVCSGWRVLDAGTGSGWLSMFLANIVNPGKVLSYEKREDFAKNAQQQIRKYGISNLRIVNKDVLAIDVKGKYDLITLDMKDCEKAVGKLHKNLAPGGWFAVYSPHIEQSVAVKDVMAENSLKNINIIENIAREWYSEHGFTHPVPSGIMHTGFLCFGKKQI